MGDAMHLKNLLVAALFIGAPISAADDRAKSPNRLHPRTPPALNSPAPTKKDFSQSTDDPFGVPATRVTIRTSTGEDKNLEAYLHTNLHHVHGEVADLQKQIGDLQTKLDAQSNTHTKALTDHKRDVARQIDDAHTTHSNKPVCVVLDKDKGTIVTLNDAVGYLKQSSEQNEQEIREVKVAHDGRIKKLEAKLEAAENAAAVATEHKGWSRWLMDHFVASALVATGLYHASALNGIITQTVPALLRSTVTQVLPYMYLPAGILFAGMLATDMHHNLQETAFNNNRNNWKSYCASQKWNPIKNPSDFFVSTAVITKAFTDNIGHVIKPACKVLVGISIVQLMLGAGSAPVIPKIPSIS
jgi:hypothetical protein